MIDKYFKEESRKNWCADQDDALSEGQIKLGCILRIADATELMSKNHQELIRERDNYKKWYEEERDKKNHLMRRIISLKGVITKIKKGIYEA